VTGGVSGEPHADRRAAAGAEAPVVTDGAAYQARLEALLEVIRDLATVQPVGPVIETIAKACGRLLGADSVGFRELHGDALVLAGDWGDTRDLTRRRTLAVGESVSGIVAATGEPLVVCDVAHDARVTPAHRDALETAGYRHWLGVPAKIGRRLVGVFSLRTRRETGFSEPDIAIATAFAAQAAIAVERARLHAEGERRRQTAERLAEVGRLISQSLDLQDVAQRVVTSLRSLVPALRTALYRVDPDSDILSLIGESMEPGLSIPGNMGFHRGEGVPGLALVERRLVVTPNLLTDPRIRLSPERNAYWAQTAIRAVAAVPLLASDSIVGVLAIADREGRAFSDEELRTLELFADQASVAVDNARLYEQARRAYRELAETQAQLLQAGKLAAVGQLVAGVAHEINNPLAVVMGQAQLIALHATDAAVVERSEQILRAATRAAGIVRELQTFARPQPTQHAPVQMSDVVDRVLALRRQTLEVSGIRVERHVAPAVPSVQADALQLEQVVLNLLLNAEQAVLDSRGSACITLGVATRGDRVRVSISDTGPGIADDVMPRIFEPFFTTRPVGRGTGLGLSISYRIVEAHGGRLWAESEPGRGATLIMELPASPGPHAAGTASPASAARPGRTDHVLVIDDEADVADTLRVLFESLAQAVTVATDGERAWQLLTTPGAAYGLVTLDLKMPGLSGPRLWDRLVAARSPMLSRIAFVTGDTVDPDTERFLASTGRPVLAKPFRLHDLIGLLEGATARS
jgi:signal transduction histidine kinase